MEIIYVQPHIQPIFLPADEDDDEDDVPWEKWSLVCASVAGKSPIEN